MPLTTSYARGSDTPAVRDITAGDLLKDAAASAPDRLALIEGIPDADARRQWTYQELLDESMRAARALATRFDKGDRVAVWSQNTPEWVFLEFGCALAGVVLVTVNPAFRSHEVEYVLKQSRAQALFVAPSFRGNPMLEVAREVQPQCPELAENIEEIDPTSAIASISASVNPISPGTAPGIFVKPKPVTNASNVSPSRPDFLIASARLRRAPGTIR